jgi:hypothetical protein
MELLMNKFNSVRYAALNLVAHRCVTLVEGTFGKVKVFCSANLGAF